MKINLRHITLASAAALCLGAGATLAWAQGIGNHGQLSSRDYKFVNQASQGGVMEVTLGQLAQKNGTDPSVRDFGKRMVEDHQKANQQLSDLVQKKGASLSYTSSKKDDKMVEHLTSLTGPDFDKAYIKEMVSDHKTDIKDFQTEAEKGDDADLKAWVTQTLPTLQEHLRLAETAESTISGVKSQTKLDR